MDLDNAEKEAFINEVNDGLQRLGDLLLDFENNPDDEAMLNLLFRIAHTIKGNAGFVNLEHMVQISHSSESLFSLIRDGRLRIDSELTEALLEGIDRMKDILEAFIADEDTEAFEGGVIAQKIESLTRARLAPEENAEVTESEAPVEALPGQRFKIDIKLKSDIALPGMRAYLIRTKVMKIGTVIEEIPPVDDYDLDGFNGEFGFLVSSEESQEEISRNVKNHEIDTYTITPLSASTLTPATTGDGDSDPLDLAAEEIRAQSPGGIPGATAAGENEVLIDLGEASDESGEQKVSFADTEVKDIARTAVQKIADATLGQDTPGLENIEKEVLFVTDDKDFHPAEGAATPAQVERRKENIDTLRVPIRRVDDLLNLVGELLSANSAYLALASEFRTQFGNKGLYAFFRENSEELTRIGAELQEKVMKVRMVPVGTVFSRFRRLIRDYNSRHPEKIVNLEIAGEDTEVDKRQIDHLYEPLLHLVRNSMDHGVEPVALREQAGKTREGTISLVAHQSGNNIYIEVEDDGAGLSLDKIRATAVRSGLLKAEEVYTYSEQEIINFIFLPGFSTSATVTDISGRGVGMDVVNKNIESLRGAIEVETSPGVGTRFIIRVPLSMAIVTALKVIIGGHLFAIPITVILETIKITDEDISLVDKIETIKVRGNHVSLVRLVKEMGMDPAESKTPHKRPVIVVQYNSSRVGLMVDDLIGYEDMVVKSLAKNYEDVAGLAGAAILGKGEICLIMDIQKLIDSIMIKSDRSKRLGDSRVMAKLGAGTTHENQQAPRSASELSPSSRGQAPAAETIAPAADRETRANQPPARQTQSDAQPGTPGAGAPASTTPTDGFHLNEQQIGLIKKVIATGRRSAMAAIHQLTENPGIQMNLSTTRILPLHRLQSHIQELSSQAELHACYVNLEIDILGNEVLLITRENMNKLATMMYGEKPLSRNDQEIVSAIREMTNIMAVSFTNAINMITGLRVLPTAPEYLENAHRLFQEKLLFEQNLEQAVILIETEFTHENSDSLLHFYVLPERRGFSKLVGGHS